MALRLLIIAGIAAVFAAKLELPDYLVQQDRPVIFYRTEIIEGIVFTPWVDLMSNDDWFISVKGCVNCNLNGFTNTTDPRFAASRRNFSVTYGSFGEVANGRVSGRIWKLGPIQGGPFEIPIVDEISSVSATWNPDGEPSSARIGLNSDFSNRMKLKSIYLNFEYICSSADFDSDENTGLRKFVSGDIFPMREGHILGQVHAIADVTPNKDNYWQFQVHYAGYGAFDTNNHYHAFEAVLSSTSPYIHAPLEFIEFISAHMQPVEESESGDYIVDCNQRVLGKDILFFVNGGRVSLKALHYTMRDPINPKICALRIRPLPEGEDRWILGIPFLEAVDVCLGLKSKTIVFGDRDCSK